jgi:hypothetical protein
MNFFIAVSLFLDEVRRRPFEPAGEIARFGMPVLSEPAPESSFGSAGKNVRGRAGNAAGTTPDRPQAGIRKAL